MTAWMITFDVASDLDRIRIHRLLERHGPRVLHTLYEIELDDTGTDGLFAAIARHMHQGDHLLAVPACSRCGFAARGGVQEESEPWGWLVP